MIHSNLIKKFPGFTLVELLVAVVIFAIVALISTSSLTTAVRLQLAHKQIQNRNAGTQRALQEIAADIQTSRKSPDSILAVRLTGTDTNYPNYPDDSLLYLVMPKFGVFNQPLQNQYQYLAYCAEPQRTTSDSNQGKRLVRFSFNVTGSATPPLVSQIKSITKCTSTELKTRTGLTISREELSEEQLDVLNLRFWLQWSTAQAVIPTYTQDPGAVRIEIATVNNPNNIIANKVELRAGAKDGQPIVLQTTVTRNSKYTYQAF